MAQVLEQAWEARFFIAAEEEIFGGDELALYMSTAATLASQKVIKLDDKISFVQQEQELAEAPTSTSYGSW